MERSTYYKIATVIGVAALSQGAFSWGVRKKILERDKADVWDGSTERLEASHISHKKGTEIYNSESNGRMLSTRSHYIDHFNRHGSETLGITEEGNKWSLRTIWARLTEEEKAELPPPEEAGKKVIPIPKKKK